MSDRLYRVKITYDIVISAPTRALAKEGASDLQRAGDLKDYEVSEVTEIHTLQDLPPAWAPEVPPFDNEDGKSIRERLRLVTVSVQVPETYVEDLKKAGEELGGRSA